MSYEKTIFIVAHGRSGSTLLMNLLNSNKNICIRGENKNTLLGIFRSYINAKKAKSEFGFSLSSKPTMPWFGIQNINEIAYAKDLVKSFIKNILRPPNDSTIIGFKEIRYSTDFFMSAEEWFLYI